MKNVGVRKHPWRTSLLIEEYSEMILQKFTAFRTRIQVGYQSHEFWEYSAEGRYATTVSLLTETIWHHLPTKQVLGLT